MNEMTPDEKATYKLLMVNIASNSTPFNIARLKEFVEIVNLRIEGSRYRSEWE